MSNDCFFPAKFITTAMLPSQYPQLRSLSGTLLPEVAVAGRSNVGKSSLLNHLFHSNKLVKTSSTPGKTQALNFFIANEVVFVDLPGYGYAKVPASIRREWGPMVQKYLEKREQLQAVLLLFDIRREPQEDDIQMIRWAVAVKKPIILVLTKIDKVNQSEREHNKKNILALMGVEKSPVICYSVPKNFGRKELCAALQAVLIKR